jgi:tetratricopeptide (TPR) repeat protein
MRRSPLPFALVALLAVLALGEPPALAQGRVDPLAEARRLLEQERADEAALESFERAHALDPSADDNLINIGATHLLMGDLGSASRHFNAYLAARRSDAESYYLVAKNYAMGEYWDLAVQHLEAAITLDEKTRRLVRRDPVFLAASDYAPFRTLLATDGFRPAPGSHQRAEVFGAGYDAGSGVLLRAALNALQFSGRPFDPNVEVTDHWALIWGGARMKLTDTGDGGGLITFSAPSSAFTAESWQREIDDLAGAIREQVALLSMRRQ